MVNQWGRDGNLPSSGGRGSSILIPAIVALLLGTGGGYAGGRFLGRASTGDIQSRDKMIEELQAEVSKARFESDNSKTADADRQTTIEDLQQQLKSAKSKIATLSKGNATLANQADQLADTQTALDKAKSQVAKLTKTLDSQADQLENLSNLAKGAELQAKINNDLRTQNSGLQDALSRAKADLDRFNELRRTALAQQDRIDELTAENKDLASNLRDLRIRLDNRDSGSDAGWTKPGQDQSGKNGADLPARIEALKTDLDQALGQLKDVQAKLKDQQTLNAKLQAQLKKSTDKTDTRPTKPDNQDKGQPDQQGRPTPRERAKVLQALDDMPGIEQLDNGQRRNLADDLVRGECITSSLKSAFGSVPKAALRDLLGQLGGKC